MLDNYEKASLDIVGYLTEDSTIFILDVNILSTIISLAKTNNWDVFTATTFDHIDLIDYIPNILTEINATLPYPQQSDLEQAHFVTELVGQYGSAWIPVSSADYKRARSTNFADDLNMVEWQRYLRAQISKDTTELTILSVDPSANVRDRATSRLKTL